MYFLLSLRQRHAKKLDEDKVSEQGKSYAYSDHSNPFPASLDKLQDEDEKRSRIEIADRFKNIDIDSQDDSSDNDSLKISQIDLFV